MQQQMKILKPAGYVKVKWKFHYKTQNRKQQMVIYCRAEQGGFSEWRKVRLMMKICQLMNIWFIIL